MRIFAFSFCHRLDGEERVGCFVLFGFLVAHECCVTLPHGVTGLSVVCDCGMSWSYSLIIFDVHSYQCWLHIYKSVLFKRVASKLALVLIKYDRTIFYINKYEPVHEISINVVCATSKASDQPAHTRSLIRAFASRLRIL